MFKIALCVRHALAAMDLKLILNLIFM